MLGDARMLPTQQASEALLKPSDVTNVWRRSERVARALLLLTEQKMVVLLCGDNISMLSWLSANKT